MNRRSNYAPGRASLRTAIINHVRSEGAAGGICIAKTTLSDKPCGLNLVAISTVNKAG